MRVAAFNVQSCRAGVERVAEVLRATSADVLMLGEVRRPHVRRLARALGMHATFGATRRLRSFGNAVLSKEQHHRELHVRFTRTPDHQPRGMVAVRLRSGVTVAATHLGLSSDERVLHAHEIVEALSRVPDPIVIGGDLNDHPRSQTVEVLLGRFRDSLPAADPEPSPTYPADAPAARIDYVLASGLEVRKAAVFPLIASDHLAVVVELG